VLLGIIFVTFVLVRSIPGDPCIAMLGERASREACADFRDRYGLNDNVVTQFARYSVNLATLNFGDSIKFQRPVGDFLMERLPMTLELSLGALFFAIVVGVPLGIISAYKHKSLVDAGTMVIANFGVSIPIFLLGYLLQILFAITLNNTFLELPNSNRLSANYSLPPLTTAWDLAPLNAPLGQPDAPHQEGFWRAALLFLSNMYTFNSLVTGRLDIFWDAIQHLILPSIALGTIPMAIIARITRSNLLDVMGLDYIRTARSKGLGERLILLRHAMRNALLPLVTIIGLQFGGLLGGAVLTETVFSLPGVGRFLVEAILARDYPVVQGFTLVIALIFVFVNLLVDISYGFLDPRIRVN
jgi:ABC-type dipeptide/oligopeptide/nickel transport system permease component